MTRTRVSPPSLPVTVVPQSEQEEVLKFKDEVNAVFLRGDFADALRMAEEGLACFTACGKRSGQAMALYQMGTAYRGQRNLAASLESFERSVQLYESLGDRRGLAIAVNGMGLTFKYDYTYSSALRCFQRSLNLANEIGDRSVEANAAGNIAAINTQIGDNATGLEMLHRALALFEELGDEHKAAIALHNIGINYVLLNDHQSAILVLERGLALLEKLGDRYHIASLIDVLGAAYVELQQFDIGLRHLQRGLVLFEALELPALIAMSLSRIGGALLQMGCLDEARTAMERSLAVNGKQGDRLRYCENLGRLGALYADPLFSEKNDATAIEMLQEARRIAEELKSVSLLCAHYGHLADVYERQGDYKEALAFHRLMHQSEKRLFNEQSDERIRNLQVRFDVSQAQQSAEIARRDAEIAQLRSVELTEALQEAEHLRVLAHAQARLDGLTGISNRMHWDEALAAGWERALGQRMSLTVLLLDIDQFKRINDTFGHGIGDATLRHIGRVLQRHCRAGDLAARYGGEEFAMLLPATDAIAGRVLGERIRAQIEAEDWTRIAPDLRVTVSIGLSDTDLLISQGGMKTANPLDLVTMADCHLYAAKANGRNQVVG